MFTNTIDSKIKTEIDSWYASNMTAYTNQLEDTVWCNDTTEVVVEGKQAPYYAAYNRVNLWKR